MPEVPSERLRLANDAPTAPGADFVLYWMIAQRRARSNFALQRAVELAREFGKPLVVLEALRCDYRWASDRLHRFVIEGMVDNERAFADVESVLYYPYVEPERGDGRGLLTALGERACAVVTDEAPWFFLPRMVAAAADALDVRLEAVDSQGLFPLAATSDSFKTAASFRRMLHAELPQHLLRRPKRNPLARVELPAAPSRLTRIQQRWPRADLEALLADGGLAELPIDHDVGPAAMRGGAEAGRAALERFLDEGLARYADLRNEPTEDVTSGLSPYLHFGHVGPAEAFEAIVEREDWSPDRIDPGRRGARAGWWRMSAPAEAFLDQLVTWRELGLNTSRTVEDHDRYTSLPEWARETLAAHADDERDALYDLEAFERARTHDELWNAAQRQLVREGRLHNYMRMVWGKTILQWTESPRDALEIMVHLNNKYAVDGRDPNSYSGIFWCLGRYDRGWPERAVLGKVRSMTLDSTRRKLDTGPYVEKYAPEASLFD